MNYDHEAIRLAYPEVVLIDDSTGIFDKDKNLIAVAKVANPVKKTIEQDYTFKLKLDL